MPQQSDLDKLLNYEERYAILTEELSEVVDQVSRRRLSRQRDYVRRQIIKFNDALPTTAV